MKDNKDFEENPVDEGKQEEGSGKKGVLTLFGHEVAKKKAIAAGLGIVCAAALVIGGVCAVNARPQAQEPEKQEQVKANPNADTDAVDEQTEGAAESAQSGDSTAKGSGNGGSTGSAAKPSGNGSSSGNGNSNSGSGNGGNSKPSHSHNWVAQTKTVHHDAQYKTVHHDAQYQTVHHDAVTETRAICNQCGADITGNTSAHMEQSFLNGGNCVSYSTKPVVVQQAYDEQVLVRDAYDEQVLVSGAWDETVTTGYACSCGATK